MPKKILTPNESDLKAQLDVIRSKLLYSHLNSSKNHGRQLHFHCHLEIINKHISKKQRLMQKIVTIYSTLTKIYHSFLNFCNTFAFKKKSTQELCGSQWPFGFRDFLSLHHLSVETYCSYLFLLLSSFFLSLIFVRGYRIVNN